MNPRRLALRSLTYYWRTNVAVVLGVATAVATLAGALLVGDSVRGSLRDLVVQRLGRTDRAIVAGEVVRDALAREIEADPEFHGGLAGICPLVAIAAGVSDAGGRRPA